MAVKQLSALNFSLNCCHDSWSFPVLPASAWKNHRAECEAVTGTHLGLISRSEFEPPTNLLWWYKQHSLYTSWISLGGLSLVYCCTGLVQIKLCSSGLVNMLKNYFLSRVHLEVPIDLLSILMLSSINRVVTWKEKTIITGSFCHKELQRSTSWVGQWLAA